jgi:hypothetical protein
MRAKHKGNNKGRRPNGGKNGKKNKGGKSRAR